MQVKVVTKRHGEEPVVEGAKRLLKTISDLRGEALIPKGVYRFSTFKEADEWMTREIASTHARLKSKMS